MREGWKVPSRLVFDWRSSTWRTLERQGKNAYAFYWFHEWYIARPGWETSIPLTDYLKGQTGE
jgi:hypothetical protein